MLIETGIYQLLTGSAEVSALVADRVFASVLPQTVGFPAVTYRPPGDSNRERVDTLDGICDHIIEFIEVLSVSEEPGEYMTAALLDDAICTLLHNYTGTVTDTAASPDESLFIQRIFEVRGKAHLYMYDDESQRHYFLSKFEIHYQSV